MAPIDEFLTIDTPENVSFDFEVAGIGSRFLAALIDTTLILILQLLAVTIVIMFYLSLPGGSMSGIFEGIGSWVTAFAGLIGSLFLWGFYIFFETTWNGQTPGKRLARLRVICVDGRPISLTEALIRNLVRLVDFLPGFYGVGVIAMFIQPQSRRLGDLAAGTLVVYEKQQSIELNSLNVTDQKMTAPASPISTSSIPSNGISSPVHPTSASNSLDLPLERLSDNDRLMVEDFLRRAIELDNAEALGHRMVTYLWQKMDLPIETLPHHGSVKTLMEIYQGKKTSN